MQISWGCFEKNACCILSIYVIRDQLEQVYIYGYYLTWACPTASSIVTASGQVCGIGRGEEERGGSKRTIGLHEVRVQGVAFQVFRQHSIMGTSHITDPPKTLWSALLPSLTSCCTCRSVDHKKERTKKPLLITRHISLFYQARLRRDVSVHIDSDTCTCMQLQKHLHQVGNVTPTVTWVKPRL